MLKNKKVVYFCQECGYESSKWMGQCPGCRAWNTFVEETVSTKKVSSTGSGLQNGLRRAEPVVLKDIRLSEDERKSYKIDRNISLGCTIHSAGSIYKNTKECVRDIQRDACKKK